MNGEIWNWKDVAKKDGNGREKKEGKRNWKNSESPDMLFPTYQA